MPLTAVNFVPVTGQIKAADVRQFFDLFTGVMTDQAVTFANSLHVGGSQGAATAAVRVDGVALQTANMLEVRTLATDVQPVFVVDKAGTVSWGPGGGTGVDTSLTRTGVSTLTFQGALVLKDANGHTTLQTASGSAAAINFVQVSNSATGVGPQVAVLGGDTDIDLRLVTKGAGSVIVPTGNLSLLTGSIGVNTAVSASIAALIKGTTNDNTAYSLAAQKNDGTNIIYARNDGSVLLGSAGGAVGFFGSAGSLKGSVTGSRGGIAALASLITYLANMGILTDASSA